MLGTNEAIALISTQKIFATMVKRQGWTFEEVESVLVKKASQVRTWKPKPTKQHKTKDET